MDDFFKCRVRREIVNVVTAIGQASDGSFDITELGGPDDDAFETTIDNGWQRFPPLTGEVQNRFIRQPESVRLPAAPPLIAWPCYFYPIRHAGIRIGWQKMQGWMRLT
jgi:hypothetical protein